MGNASTTAKEYFNMKHSSTRNVIERAFGVLKGRWAILHNKPYYLVQIQCQTILTCCLLQNLINREMTNVDFVDDVDERDSTYATIGGDDIQFIGNLNKWTQWRDDLAAEMFNQWQLRNQWTMCIDLVFLYLFLDSDGCVFLYSSMYACMTKTNGIVSLHAIDVINYHFNNFAFLCIEVTDFYASLYDCQYSKFVTCT